MTQERNPGLVTLLRQLWQHISARRRLQVGAIGVLMLVATVAELVSLGAVVPFLSALAAPQVVLSHKWARNTVALLGLSGPKQLVLVLAVVFAIAALAAGATRLALLWGQTRLGNAIGVDLGTEAYRRTLYQPYIVHVRRNSSEILAGQVTKINAVVYAIVIPFLTLITSGFIVIVVIALMVWIEPSLATATFFGLGALYGILAHTSRKRLTRDSQRVAVEQTRVTQLVQEGLGGVRDVLIDGLQEPYARIYHQVEHELQQAVGSIAILGAVPRPIIESLGVVLIGGLAYTLSNRPGGIASAVPMLGALALAAQRLLPLVQQIYSGWAQMRGSQSSLRDVLQLLDQPLPAHGTLRPAEPLEFKERIKLSGVHFRYEATGPWVLKGIELTIPRGSRFGFIGPTGSGKSTLLDIIMGLLNPTLGRLCIDQTAVEDSTARSWQMHIAHVPQSIYLADASIADNIAFGVAPASIDRHRVREAAEKAQLADVIESWSAGYDTYVGERGVRLSGGQRQRIGIARALYKRANVLVFDEATSALDSDTERRVMESVHTASSDLTILMVAHRLTTLSSCDQIVRLHEGVIDEIGSYAAIVSADDKNPERHAAARRALSGSERI